jgi:hypothetical protein
MRIDDHTIVFRSTNEWYETERGGGKPYTVRWIDHAEWTELITAGIEDVRIEHADLEGTCFTRRVRGVSFLGEMLGRVLLGVCWHD